MRSPGCKREIQHGCRTHKRGHLKSPGILFSSNLAMHVAKAPTTCSLSCILKGWRLPKVQNKRQSSRSRDSLEQKGLAPSSTRELCPSSPLPEHEHTTVSEVIENKKMEQSQSAFMSRLPSEVRTLIYEEVLCRPVGIVHISTRRDGKLVYFRCKTEDGLCRGLACFRDADEELYSTWRTRDKDLFSTWNPSVTQNMAEGGLVALLQSCRQMSVFLCLYRNIQMHANRNPATLKL